jgi:hypothetical protein
VKRLFDGTQVSSVLDFGGPRDNDRAHGILKGKLNLTKDEVSKTFDVSVSRIVDSCLKLLAGRKILVGNWPMTPSSLIKV